MFRLTLIAIILLAASPAFSEDISLCRDGWNKSAAGNHDESLSLFNKCIETGNLSNASLAQTYRNMGIVYKRMGRYTDALDFHDLALSLNPQDPWAEYVNKGIVWLKMKEYDKALKNYNKALELNPGYAQAYFGRGELFEIQGDTQKAIVEYQKAYDAGWRAKPLYDKMLKHGLIKGQ